MDLYPKTVFQIKGIQEGLLINFGEGDWTEIQEALLTQISENGKFFHGAKLAIDLENRSVSAAELSTFRDQLSNYHVCLWAVLCRSASTIKVAQDLGLATKIRSSKNNKFEKPLESSQFENNALFLNKTVRSGMRVEAPKHAVIFGDVNPGGEVIAGGSILIWGRCRGAVHAGMEGDADAVVCALDLSPSSLRINGLTALLPKRKGKPQPEKAFVNENQVVKETWNPTSRDTK
jgi:septum site-determining protein MinC